MEAYEVVRLFVNKAIVPAEPKRRENPGYGRVKALRILVIYARLKGLDNDTTYVEHLKRNQWIAKTLGLEAGYQIELLLADGGDATCTFWRRLS